MAAGSDKINVTASEAATVLALETDLNAAKIRAVIDALIRKSQRGK